MSAKFHAQELIDAIIDYHHRDKRILGKCSLVSPAWLPRSRFHLFRNVHVILRTPCWDLDSALAFFNATPSVCGYVRHLHIRADEDMIYTKDKPGNGPVSGMPQDWIHLRTFSRLPRHLPRLHSLELSGVYPIGTPNNSPRSIDESAVFSVRSLTMQGVDMPFGSLYCFWNTIRMFPALDELHLLDLAVDGKERFMRLLTDNSVYPVTKLEVRNAQAVMYLVPEKVFRRVNVLHADMKLLLLVKTLFFTPLYDVLEELTLTSSGRYHVEALAKMDGHFVSSCLRLKALHILDSRSGRQTDYSPAIIFRGFKALLDISPKTLSHVSVGFLLFRWDKRQMDQLKSMEWEKLQELVLGRFPMLAKLSVVGVPDALTPATAGLLIAPIPAAWKSVVRSRLGADFLDKVVFE